MPTASEVIITWSMQVGATLTVSYQYTGDNPEWATEYQWYRNGEAIIGETSNTYTLLITDQTCDIICAVCPIDDQGNVGQLAFSEPLDIQYYAVTVEPIEKQYIVKLYNANMQFVKVLPAGLITNDISFTESIDAGQGEMSLNVNLPIDTNYFNGIRYCKVYVSDNTGVDNLLIYSGWLSKVSRVYSNQKENIQVIFLSLYSLLQGVIIRKDGLQNGDSVFTKTWDPADILKFIIDYFVSIYPNTLSYTASSIDTYGTSITLEFNTNNCGDAIQNLVNGLSYYLFVWADGVVHFHPTPVSATHLLTYEKDITALTVPEDKEKVANTVQVTYNDNSVSTPTSIATDPTSISLYGVKEVVLSREDLTNQTSAELYRDEYLNEHKNEVQNIQLTVSCLYPIENIHPGDTVKIRNNDLNIDNAQIYKVTYKYEQVQVTLNYYTNIAEQIFN